MATIKIEIAYNVNSDNGNISFLTTDLFGIAEEQIRLKIVQCSDCGRYFIRERGNPKICFDCR
mgnify:CR=1 FL=1